jgi:hypothetical protein
MATSILSWKFVKEKNVFRWKNQRRRKDQSPESSGAELQKMGNSNDFSFIRMSIPHNRSL